jgi:spore coat protein H
MLRWVILLAGLSLVLPRGAAADDQVPGATVFQDNLVHTVHVKLTDEAWNAMTPIERPRQILRPPSMQAREYPYTKAEIDFDGQTLKDVAIRFKGNSSFRSSQSSLKRPFKMDFNEHVEGQKLDGLTSLCFSNHFADPSGIREHLAYALARESGLPASRTSYARMYLTIPGKYDRQYLGLYTIVEPVNKLFLRTHFGSDKGLLLKPERAANLPMLGNDWDSYKAQYDPKTEGTPFTQRKFIDLLDVILSDDKTFSEEIEQRLDVDQFLRYLAVNGMMANLDSFLCTGHNFYLYFDPATGKATFIPWDLNMAFASFTGAGPADQQADLSLNRPYVGENRLIERILAIPRFKARYDQHVKELAAKVFVTSRLLKRIESTAKLIAPAMEEEQKARVDGIWGLFGGANRMRNAPDLDQFITIRIESISKQLSGESSGTVLTRGRGFARPGGNAPMPERLPRRRQEGPPPVEKL